MEAIQLDLFATIVPPRTKELCTGWQNSVKNDCDVFVTNVRRYGATKAKNWIEIKVALLFPYIYIADDLETGTYGRGPPCMETSKRFSVYDDMYQVASELTDWLAKRVSEDGNLSGNQRCDFIKMIPAVIDKFIADV